jgi:hypothetical protein
MVEQGKSTHGDTGEAEGPGSKKGQRAGDDKEGDEQEE